MEIEYNYLYGCAAVREYVHQHAIVTPYDRLLHMGRIREIFGYNARRWLHRPSTSSLNLAVLGRGQEIIVIDDEAHTPPVATTVVPIPMDVVPEAAVDIEISTTVVQPVAVPLVISQQNAGHQVACPHCMGSVPVPVPQPSSVPVPQPVPPRRPTPPPTPPQPQPPVLPVVPVQPPRQQHQVCPYCLDTVIPTMLAVPCRHLVCCYECRDVVKAIRKCIICQRRVRRRLVRVYLP